MRITPSEVRFIKLGKGGTWEAKCIDGPDPTVRFGFDSPHHQACLNGDWATVEAYWKERDPKEATKIVNQTKAFYTLGEDALWITFYKRKLYWCFAAQQVEEIEPHGSRIRKVPNGWSCNDIAGHVLFTDSLSGRLTRVQGFRGTICKVREQDYLLKRINGEALEDVHKASVALESLKCAVRPLIQRLNWKDFELLIDLIFSRAGWQRLSAPGKTEKYIDLELVLPVTGRRAFVQVKSAAGLQELKDYIARFREMEQFDEMFFVVHTAQAELRDHAKSEERVTLLGLDEISSLVVDSGLCLWLMQKAS
jgi:hypothetical protein